MKVAESRTLDRGTDRDLPRVPDRYWLNIASNSGYLSFSSTISLQSNFTFSIDTKLPTNTAQFDVVTSFSSYAFRVYDNNHATKPNDIELFTPSETAVWSAAYPSDRSKGYELKLVVTSNSGQIYIDGAAVGSPQSVTGVFNSNTAFFACAGITAGNMNFNNQELFSLSDGTGTAPANSIGSVTSSFTGSSQSWVSGRLDDQ